MDAAALSEVLTRAALCGLFLSGLAAVGYAVWEVVREEWRRGGKVARRVFLVAAAGAALYGGAKQYRASVSYPPTEAGQAYLVDRGSYVTNDYVHIDFARRIVPDDAALVVERREVASTNAADWAVYLETTFAAFAVPTNLPCANATNWDWAVWADWTPPPSVQTNGVLHADWGRTTRDAALRAAGLAVGVPVRSSVALDGGQLVVPSRRLNYDAEVEYIESDNYTGINELNGQYINTELIPIKGWTVEMDVEISADYPSNWQTPMRVSNNFGVTERLGTWYISGFALPAAPFERNVWRGKSTFANAEGSTIAINAQTSANVTYPFRDRGKRIKYYSFRAWDATGALVGDFVPVRIGRKGAMFDRVTRRTFVNGGTGAFRVGPDKASALSPETAARAASDALDALTGAAETIDPTPKTEEGEDAK